MKSITVTDPTQQLSLDFSDQNCVSYDPAYGAVPSVSVLTTGDIDWSSINLDDTLTISHLDKSGGKLSLQGDDADIEINGESVVGMLKEIRDRLRIIQVSESMEAEWNELRELREQYEAKLAECREKSKAWEALKQMPPPQMP